MSASRTAATRAAAIRSAMGRHPRWADAGVAAVVAALGIPGTVPVSPGVLGWLCYAAIFVPLIWRRRAPVVVFWVLYAMVEATEAAGIDLPGAVIVFPVAIYAVARYRPRRYLWPIAIGVEAALVVAWIVQDEKWGSLVPVNAILIATALLGTNLNTRRAYLDQLEERARRLESERDQRARLATAAERARIAREMHDVVAHNLTVIVALADAAALTATTTPQAAGEKMTQVAAAGRAALGEMRRMLGVLHEPAAERGPQPGFADLDRLVEQVRAAGLRVTLTQQGEPGRWGPGAGLAVYRIVQEALTNTIKHAGPDATAAVLICCTTAGVDLEVTDDGALRPAAQSGHGLTGMTERAASFGGWVEAGPLPGRGWRVLDVVGEAGDGRQALAMVRALHPDVVLMDIRMPVLDGIEATRQIVASGAGTRIVVLTTFNLDEYVYAALRAGASGFLLKDVPPADLVSGVRAVAAGDAVVAPNVTRRLLDKYARHLPDPATGDSAVAEQLGQLTEREREVLVEVARGLSNLEVGQRLGVSETTVKTHVGRILTKLALRDRVQIVVFAYENGIARPGAE